MRVLVVSAWDSPFVRHQIEEIRQEHSVEELFLPKSNGVRWLVALAAIWKGLTWRGDRPDVVHSYSAWPSGIAGALIAARRSAKHVVHEHLSPPERLLKLPLVRAVVGCATRIVSPCHKHAEELEAMFGRPACVVRNPVIVGVPKALPITATTKVVLIGRLEPQKGFDKIPETARILKDFSFFIVGEGSQYRKLFMDAPSNLYLRSSCSHDEAMRWIATADVVVCPSRHESFGLVAAEACKLGKRVVATDVGSHRDYATILLPPNASPEQIAAGISEATKRSPREYKEPMTPFVEAIGSIYRTPDWSSLI